MDYRLLENRKKAFIDWFGWSLIIDDCDPALYMLNYFYDRFEFNIEQRLWITWIYGTTYHFPTAYVIWNEFPDMELVGSIDSNSGILIILKDLDIKQTQNGTKDIFLLNFFLIRTG